MNLVYSSFHALKATTLQEVRGILGDARSGSRQEGQTAKQLAFSVEGLGFRI